jgi:transposase-like protein
MERQKHSKEFKEQAVRLSHVSDKSVAQVAAELGIHTKMLYRWRREVGAAKDDTGRRAFPDHGRSRDEELSELRKRLRQAEMERDILKKAVTYFAQHSK